MLGTGQHNMFRYHENMTFDEATKNLIARGWIRYQSDPNTAIILRKRLPEPNYQKTLSADGDIWPYDDEPEGILTMLTLSDHEIAHEIAYDITLKIIGLTDDERLLALVAAGSLESLIKYQKYHKKFRKLYENLATKSPKHKHVLSMVWL